MALPATDSFTTGTSQTLTDYSANWTNNNGSFWINEAYDALGGNASQELGAHWNADSFDNNQYAEIKIVASGSGNWIGAAVRCHTSSAVYYGFYTGDSSDYSYLFRYDSGAGTPWLQLGSDGAYVLVNEVMRLEADGTTITPLVDGSEEDPPGAQTNSEISSGYAGVSGYGTGSNLRGDDWEGGNLEVELSFPPLFRNRRKELHFLRR